VNFVLHVDRRARITFNDCSACGRSTILFLGQVFEFDDQVGSDFLIKTINLDIGDKRKDILNFFLVTEQNISRKIIVAAGSKFGVHVMNGGAFVIFEEHESIEGTLTFGNLKLPIKTDYWDLGIRFRRGVGTRREA